ISDDPFENAGAEKVILLTDLRHPVSAVKEVLLRIETQFVLTERIYALQASSAGVSAECYEEWLVKDGGSYKIGVISSTIVTELP
uniref:LysR family transcriptional regulator n=1 Tax=Haemonchus placei TaxID=6290 RepID=A0A0N4W704_HAEPC